MLDDPTLSTCAVGIEATMDLGDEQVNYNIYLAYEDRDKLPLLAVEYDDGKNKEVYRGDLPTPSIVEDVNLIPFFVGYNDGNNEVCMNKKVPYYTFLGVVRSFFAVFFSGFDYVTMEEMTCGEVQCIRYCEDGANTTCVYVSDSQLLKYESPERTITYGAPFEVEDMSVFALDKEKYPGCEDQPKAYEKPAICVSSSSVASSTQSQSTSVSSKSISSASVSSKSMSSASVSSKSVSSASSIHAAVAAVLLAIAVALL